MISTDESILKRGYLQRLTTRTDFDGWERLYFVLYGSSAKNEARLDWYASKESSESSGGLRNGIFLEEISRVERVDGGAEGSGDPGQTPALVLAMFPLHQTKPIKLKCEDEVSLDEWLGQLTTVLKTVRETVPPANTSKPVEPLYAPLSARSKSTNAATTYDVDVEETIASCRQGLSGSYLLTISREHLSLLSPVDSNSVLTWHYSHVRRFGYSDRSFSIEGGQRSGCGKGLFILKTSDGQKLFEDVQEKIRMLKLSDTFVPTSSSSSSSSSYSPTPALGERSVNAIQSVQSESNDLQGTEATTLLHVRGDRHLGDEDVSWIPPIPPRTGLPVISGNNQVESRLNADGVMRSPKMNSPKISPKANPFPQMDKGRSRSAKSTRDQREKERNSSDDGREHSMELEDQKNLSRPKISEVLAQMNSGKGNDNDATDAMYASASDIVGGSFDLPYSRINLRSEHPNRTAKTENPYGQILISLRRQEKEEQRMEKDDEGVYDDVKFKPKKNKKTK